MQQLKDQVGALAQSFDVPFSRSLVRVQGGTTTRITPNPIIQENSQNDESVANSITGQTRQYSVTGVSKKYERTYLTEQSIEYLIDQTIKCELIEIKDEGLSWTLTLSEKLGEQKFAVNNYPL